MTRSLTRRVAIGALAVAACAAALPAAGSAAKLTRVAAAGDALYVTHAPGEKNRLYVVGQSGRIRILERGRTLSRPFLDISSRVSTGSEQGLLGLAFHPKYATNGRFFVNYTDRAGTTRVAEFRRGGTAARPTPNRARPAPFRMLLTIPQPFANHNGGHLAFGPDGFLYISSGDGGSGGDPFGNGQNRGTLLGKLLRIDVAGRSAGRNYRIPAGNPFRGQDGIRPEIFVYGLRNPWRFSFDRANGDLWIGDVGQNQTEEIDFLPAGQGGANFGWNAFEGSGAFGGRLIGNPHTPPVAEYGHDAGCSVTGGYVVRDARVADLAGRYVYSDFCTGRLWSMRAGPNPGGVREETDRLGVRLGLVKSFGEGADGTVFVIANEAIFRFRPG